MLRHVHGFTLTPDVASLRTMQLVDEGPRNHSVGPPRQESTGKCWEALRSQTGARLSGGANPPARDHGCPNQGCEPEFSDPATVPKADASDTKEGLNSERKNKVTSQKKSSQVPLASACPHLSAFGWNVHALGQPGLYCEHGPARPSLQPGVPDLFSPSSATGSSSTVTP